MSKLYLLLFFLLLHFSSVATMAQSNKPEFESSYLSNLSVDVQWFLSYLNGENGDKKFNEFTLKRGYVNIKKKINDKFLGRITTDLTVDEEGDGEGDVEIRLKYLYLKYQLPSFGIVHKPYFEFGLVHRPWLDFEEHINLYRVQGTMFLERNGILNSADYGISFISLLGDEMDEHYKKNVNKNYPGKYGSFALGIFNGGGYHALEKNENKSLEYRFTIRPLYKVIPGIQLSNHGAIAKGNIAESPDWNFNSTYISYQQRNVTITGEYYIGRGNFKGNAIQDTISYEAIKQNGYSLFGEWKVFNSKISLFGRYDLFTQKFNSTDVTKKRTITGIAFHFTRGSKIILDYDSLKYSDDVKNRSKVLEIAIELKY